MASSSTSARIGKKTVSGAEVDFARFLPLSDLFASLRALVGTRVPDPGTDQERNRGGALHEAVCQALGMAGKEDMGTCPDILEQLLEVKLQTSPTIDLGLVSPDDETPLEAVVFAKHSDVRYAVFYGVTDGRNVHLEHLVMCSGRDFFRRFQRFEGKIVNAKLQIPLPSTFFD